MYSNLLLLFLATLFIHLLSSIIFKFCCSAILASYFLREDLNVHGKIGCFLCLIGSVVLVIHAPQEESIATVEELGAKLTDAGTTIY